MSGRDLRDRTVAGGASYALSMAAVAMVAAWPIYQTVSFLAAAIAAVFAALLLAGLATGLGWRAWHVVVAAVGVFLAIGMSLAVPATATGASGILDRLVGVGLGVVTGWKDLVTVDLPVGGYRNLLVPALVIFLSGTLITLFLAWHPRGSALAVLPAVAMTAYGLLFGRTVVSSAVRIGPLLVPAPREIACGALALVLTLAWLAWRSSEGRLAALRRAADASGVRMSRRRTGSDARRSTMAALMVIVAVAVAVAAVPALAQGRTRDVLRSAAGPEVELARAVSPLSDYRSHFSDSAYDRPLFSVESVTGALPDRIRIATLSSYDGTVFRVAQSEASGANGSFVRVPSTLPAQPGAVSTVRIRLREMSGIWLPTFGALQQVQFAGPTASSLADAFYYDAAAQAGVDTAGGGLSSGDVYTVRASVAASSSLSAASAPGTRPQVPLPPSLKTWIEDQQAGTGGAALQTLVDRLRNRGYLSHALSVPAAGAAWQKALGPDYVFQPSTAGHSLARIDELFRRLLQRQASVAGQGAGASLVAAIGDDEQFSVATALIAEQLGFPARIVLGVRLSGAGDDVPACRGGVCTGADVTAWVEVLSSQGEWIPVDVTPQHVAGVDEQVTRERDPENATQVTPQTAQEVVPPDPVQRDASTSTPQKESPADYSALWAALRVAGLSALALFILFAPFSTVVLAKTIRRRSRRDADSVTSRIVGGWDEYVDTAVDHGMPPPLAETRSELAERYASSRGGTLAVIADRAVFAGASPSSKESDEFWRIVAEERAAFRAKLSLWHRLRAAVSLKSFTRGIAPRNPRARAQGPRNERRGRRDGGAR